MEIICWMQTPPPVCQLPQGLVMLLPPLIHTHFTPPPATSDVASFVSHGVSSSAQSTLLFHVHRLFLSPPPFYACSCSVIQTDTLTLQASYNSLVSSALCFNPLPDVASSGTDLVVVKILCDDYIDFHLWLISCFTVTVVQH